MTRGQRLRFFCYAHRTGLGVTALAVMLAALPLVQRNPYTLGVFNLIALHVIVVLGLNLFIGYAGQISLGNAAFFGLGAYGSAVCTVTLGWWPWPSLMAVALAVAAIAVVVGVPALRLSGHYLAMATLGFNVVVHTVLVQWDQVTGGPSGFSGIPPLTVAGWAVDDEIRFHYVAWSVALIALTLGLNLVRSGVGRGLAALAGNESVARTLGVDTARAKVKVFVLSAVLASVAGSLYAHCYGFVSPDSFGIFASVDFAIMVVVGGLGSVWGSLFGAAVITLLPEYLDVFETYKEVLHGAILVGILLFLPHGLVSGLLEALRLRTLGRRRHARAG